MIVVPDVAVAKRLLRRTMDQGVARFLGIEKFKRNFSSMMLCLQAMIRCKFWYIVLLLSVYTCFGEIHSYASWHVPLYTSLRDQKKYGAENTIVDLVYEYIVRQSYDLLPYPTQFSPWGPKQAVSSRTNAVYGVEFYQQVRRSESGMLQAFVQIFYHNELTGFVFDRFRFSINLGFLRVVSAERIERIYLKDKKFQVRVGVMERKVVVASLDDEIKKIYPAGVGGFSLDLTKLKTPNMRKHYLRRDEKYSIPARFEPWYYLGYPFLKILNGYRYEAYGFHATMDPARGLERGFTSTGCIRLQIKDLYELYAIVTSNKVKATRIDVGSYTGSSEDSPYPFTDNKYARELDGTKGDDGLTKMKIVEGKPPLTKLQ